MKQYWNETVTEKSYHFLLELSSGHSFVLIGGWAVYLHPRAQKSRDIDIVADYGSLLALEKEFGLLKNERLAKYEIRTGEFDVDIYVPKFSRLSYPVEKILENHNVVDGIRVATVPQLLMLKLGAWKDRAETPKGEKDAIDIVSLLYHAESDAKEIVNYHRLKTVACSIRLESNRLVDSSP